MNQFQQQKALVRDYFAAMESLAKQKTSLQTISDTLSNYTSDDYTWRGVYPFREQSNAAKVAELFWQPLFNALKHMQRREDVFIAGENKYDGKVWVMSMGNFMGLFDNDILGIPCSRKLANLRYAEFSCVEDGKISKTGLFVDFIGLMLQVGINPLPPSTGAYFNYPGPRKHDGLLYDDAKPNESAITLDLVDRMVNDLSRLNESGSMSCPPELLAETWSDDMLWYGPAGIGATYTIERYQEQHQLPFRGGLKDKQFNGSECRFAEGDFACFFGWPNLSSVPIGGWLGLPGGGIKADMQVVDVYRREGDKLAENWVLLDIPYWLKQQGLDVFKRTQQIINS